MLVYRMLTGKIIDLFQDFVSVFQLISTIRKCLILLEDNNWFRTIFDQNLIKKKTHF